MNSEPLWASLYVSLFSKWFATETEACRYVHDKPSQHRRVGKAMRCLSSTGEDAAKWAAGQRYEHGYRVYLEFWPAQVTLYVDGWNNPVAVPCSVTRGETNWDQVYRYDVRFTSPVDGWDWYGKLITGGNNDTFKVRRTKESSLFRTSQRGNPCKDLLIVPADVPGYLKVSSPKTGQELFATLRNGKWLTGPTVPDIVTDLLLA